MKFLRRSATITLVLMSLYCGSKGQNQSLALLPFLGTGSVGVSPSTAGAGQPVATGGATAAADMENPASVQAAVPAGAASGDHTPPRLLRMEWPTTCTMTGAGWLRCDPKPTGPIFVFDKPIDCASAPKLNGHTIENGGTIKAYSLRASYTNGMGYDHYIIDGDYQSIAIVSECDANKVRVHPVIDEHQQGVGGPIEGGFMPNTYTVVLAGGIKDTAGNATLDGDSRFAGPVGDVRSNTEMDTVINSPYAVDVVTYVGPAAIRANTYDYLADFILMPWIDQRPTTDGKLRFLMPSFPVACDDLNLIRSNFLIETVLWDDFKAGRPFQTFPIQGVACEPVEGLNPRLVITNPIPVGSLVRITVQGTFTNSQKNMTMGSGRFMQLFENVNGVSQPIPRSFRYMQWRWPENLGTQPSCQTLEVDQAVTYFDSAQTYGPYCADAAGPFLQPNTSKPEYYFYIGGGMPALNTGYCVEYSGPAWSSTDAALAKLEKNCSTVIPGLPQSFQKYNGPRFAEYASCETSAGVISGYGTSYFDTGVAGVCIENPGKTNEYAIYYFNYEDKVAARTVCKGLWRESGLGYATKNYSGYTRFLGQDPGTIRKIPVSVCPNTEVNTGASVTTQLPSGQTCDGRTIEVDSTGARWFNTTERSIPVPGQPGKYTKIKGIHTYWQNEPLKIKVKKNCQAGWYKLTFKGMNVDGPLPDFYKGFALNVKNGSDDVAAALLPASDSLYAAAGVTVYLKEGDTTLELNWKNDAYKEGVYDANLHLNSVAMSFVSSYKPATKLAKTAREFCSIEGRFFFGDKTGWTDWANQQISYCYPSLKSGKYDVTIKARNHGKLPEGYKAFLVNVEGDGVQGVVSIPASSDTSNTGKTTLDLTQGDRKLNVTWQNDQYVSDDLDAAIEIESITLKRVGNSERSQLAAFLLQTGRAKGMLSFGIAALLISALGILALSIRERTRRR